MMRSSNRFGLTHDRPRMAALVVIFAGMLVVGAVTGRGLGQCITNETDKLLASDGAAGDILGFSVAISGDVAIVGANFDDDNGPDSGSAYVYRFDGMTWVQEQKLLASDGAANDLFGNSVAISGEVAIVGAPFHDDNGSFAGSV